MREQHVFFFPPVHLFSCVCEPLALNAPTQRHSECVSQFVTAPVNQTVAGSWSTLIGYLPSNLTPVRIIICTH